MTPPRESPVNFGGSPTGGFDPEEATRLGPAPSDDTTGLPPSAGGVRHLKLPAPERGPLEEGQKFSPRYHIIKLLGIGGMGAVYQAWDAELSVAVAVKVIRPEVSQDPVAAREIERRFKQELLLARQVTHKNVVRIFDLGEIDGIKYITMSYIQGTDLATTLRQSGRLAVPTVMPLARQIVEGLKAAHEAGVVHRDLKPANIMIEGGEHAIVMDFGIARSTSQGGAVQPVAASTSATDPESIEAALDEAMTQAAATVAGAVVGTVEYMAPEQARGQPVDQRADIYAFGLILYDLLVGRRRAEHAPSAIAELRTRMEKPPPPARSIVPEIPEPLDKLVSRCVEPDPAARFQTTEELATALGELDDQGELLPIQRVFGMRVAVAALGLFMALLVGTWWFSRGPGVPVQHDPVSVLIADFANSTNDPTFDRTLESTLRLALEGAGFISAYDRTIINRIGVAAPERLDERAAQEIAVKQGVGVVLSGSLNRQGERYTLSLRATQPVTGNVITNVEETVSDKNQVLAAATGLATAVREALGDDTSDSAQRFAMDTLTATSLEAVHQYAVAQEALSNNRWEEARNRFTKAVELDPNFGAAYSGMAITSRNMGQLQDAEKYAREAVRHLDRMSERERYRARGLLYYLTSDYQTCVKEYGDLLKRYAADVAARNNLALCQTYLREMSQARDEMQRVVKILPKRALYRYNLSLYSGYGGDFPTAEQEARTAMELGSSLGRVALAFAQLGQDQLVQAAVTYEELAQGDALASSYAASGLADLALYEGRFADAARILERGTTVDQRMANVDRAAAKFAALAYARISQGQMAAAMSAAETALKHSTALKIRFLAARVFVEAGQIARAQSLAKDLASEAPTEPQVLAKIIEGGIALKSGRQSEAIKVLTEANSQLNTWIGRFDLGRAYLEAGLLLQADSEFDACLKRRGEALSLFLDEEPTYGFLPVVYYYQGRVREGLKSEGFVASYRAYLNIREKAGQQDPLLPDVRKRIATATATSP